MTDEPPATDDTEYGDAEEDLGVQIESPTVPDRDGETNADADADADGDGSAAPPAEDAADGEPQPTPAPEPDGGADLDMGGAMGGPSPDVQDAADSSPQEAHAGNGPGGGAGTVPGESPADAAFGEPEQADTDPVAKCLTFLDRYCQDELGRLYRQYPNDTEGMVVSHRDLRSFDPDLADDVLAAADEVAEWFRLALSEYDAPVDMDVSDAEIRFVDLPETHTFYPGQFSPTDEAGGYRALRGDVNKATHVFPKLVRGAFECLRCGTINRTESGDPAECQGCEREGPFDRLLDECEFIDAQILRLKTPAEEDGGAGDQIDVRVEGDDLTGVAEAGDRITTAGTIHLEEENPGNDHDDRFRVYQAGQHIDVEESDHTNANITPEIRERINALVSGEEGDPLELAAESLAPKIFGYADVKKMLILSMVSGHRTVYPDGSADRGSFHVLLVGDPSTAKSKLVNRVQDIGWRTVGVSGKDASTAGLTAGAIQEEFGGRTEWSIEAGAFVQAHRGTVCIDELDDMDPDVRSSMLPPMANQKINVSKVVNAELAAQTAVIASANPAEGRFNNYDTVSSQLNFGGALLSRFDLIYTFHDRPDPEGDREVAGHILGTRDTAKRIERGEIDPDSEAAADVATAVDPETLRAWIALAKQQPAPVWDSPAVEEQLKEAFADLRGLYDYEDSEPIPVTFRKLEGLVRVAEAAAKFEFSETITERHAEIATEAVGKSMQDFATDEDGNLDADVQETGQSRSQAERRQAIKQKLLELQNDEFEDEPGVPVDELEERFNGDTSNFDHDLQHFRDKGDIYEPRTNQIRLV